MSAVVIVLFLAWHVWSTRIQLALGNVTTEGFYELLRQQFHDPLWLVVYVLGISAAALHFGNGLWGFLVSWGFLTSRRSQKAFAGVCIAFGALVLAGFVNVAYHYATDKAHGGLVPWIEGKPVHAHVSRVDDVEILP